MNKFIVIVSLFFFASSFSFASEMNSTVVAEAMQISRSKDLSNARYWEILLHYKRGVSGYRSLIDDQNFFLSENGNTDKQAELEATIKGILQPAGDFAPNQHPQCRFPARTAWLATEIPLIAENLPEADCPNLMAALKRVNPYSATMVFPFYNMSGPASMYGHTMIRLESENRSPLLGYAVTYAANAENAGTLAYIFKGIFGGFDGVYSVLPYSEKLNEYSSIEQRDVWEYELNLTPEEVKIMFLHIWEVSLVVSDYYFFDENCAYNLLFLLESARPDKNLTDGFVWVIPLDTIMKMESEGFIKKVTFRPSYAKKMNAMALQLSRGGVKTAKAVAKGDEPISAITESDMMDKQKVAALDLASELLRNDYHGTTYEEQATYRVRSIEILKERSKYSLVNHYDVDIPDSPHLGHRSSRLFLSGGSDDQNTFFRLGYRPSYHSLIDSQVGYLEGSELNFGQAIVRYFPEYGKLNLERLEVISVVSLNKVNEIQTPMSWRMSFGLEDLSFAPDYTFMVGYVRGGFGYTVPAGDNSLVWGMLALESRFHGDYTDNVIGGAGFTGGVILPYGTENKFIFEGNYKWFTDYADHREGDFSVNYARYLSQNSAMTVETKWKENSNRFSFEWSLTYALYF